MSLVNDNAYNLKRVAVLFDAQLLGGAPDGDFVNVEPTGSIYNMTAGARGEVAVSRNNDESGTITLRLWQSATSQRRIIENKIRLQKELGLQPGLYASIEVKDFNTNEHIIMDQCWIQDPPSHTFGGDAQAREYVFAFATYRVMPL